MITSIPKTLPVVYNMEKDTLVVEIPKGVPALSASMLKALCDYIYNIDFQRYKKTPPGDRKEVFEKKLSACRRYKIQQVLFGQGRDINLFKTTRSLGITKYYHG